MIAAILTTLRDAVAHNQFLSGGFLLMVGGFLLNWARQIPSSVHEWLLRRYTTTIVVESSDDLYWWVQYWLSAHPTIQRSGNLAAASRAAIPATSEDEQTGEDARPTIVFSPAPGRHWLTYRGHWLSLDRSKNTPGPGEGRLIKWAAETMTLRLYSRNRAVARTLFEEARDLAMPPEDRRATVYGVRYDSWHPLMRTILRTPNSVILEAGLMDELVLDVEEFLRSAAWYAARGLPYRRGYLLHGPPGNGKSSAIAAVAAHVRYNPAILSLGSDELTDGNLRSIFASIPPRSILVIEDVDRDLTAATDDGQVQTHNNKLTFSAILNLLDGIGTPEGRVLFMTTNHRERLDPAMIRPGRVDREFLVGDAAAEQAERLFLRYFPGHHTLAGNFATEVGDRGLSMAKLQGHLLLHRDDPEAAAQACRLLDAEAVVN